LPERKPCLDLRRDDIGRSFVVAYALGLALAVVVDEHPPLAFVLSDFDRYAGPSLK